jgi:secreted PhoX family phosphatase
VCDFVKEPEKRPKSDRELRARMLNEATRFYRPEDGCWSTSNPREFFFTTTGIKENIIKKGETNEKKYGPVPGRLWKLRFDENWKAGEITLLVEGFDHSDNKRMLNFDNIVVDRRGNILIQDDPENKPDLAAVWHYDVSAGVLTKVVEHNPLLFGDKVPGSIDTDEESSGIIDAHDILGPGWFIVGVQTKADAGDPELVTQGQILAIYVPQSDTSRA